MAFQPNRTYRIYTKTFNNTLAFPTRANYRFFLTKIKNLDSLCEVICYCLMPDHLDLIVFLPEHARGLRRTQNNQMQVISRAIGNMLSSYARAYNKQKGRKGSLFQPKAKAVLIQEHVSDHIHNIHFGPVTGGLVFDMNDWEFSSYREYHGSANGICNTTLGRKLLRT